MIKNSLWLPVLLGLLWGCSAGKAPPGAPAEAGEGVAVGSDAVVEQGVVLDPVEQANAELALVDQKVSEKRAMAEESERIMQELKLRGAEVRLTKRGVVVNLPDVLFAFDSAELTADALRAIREIALVAKGYPHRHIAVEGHTDGIGTVLYNKKLSDERAHQVASQLVKEGLPQKNMTVFGFGETTPISSNRTETGRKRNRRVEVILENK